MSVIVINFYHYLIQHLPVVLLVIPLVLWMWLNWKTLRPWKIALGTWSIVTLVAAAAILIGDFPQAAQHVWSERLAPIVSWTMGYRLYYPPGEGPVLTRYYGPISSLIYAPAALAARPTTAALIGASINVVLFFAPAYWFLIRGRQNTNFWLIATAAAIFTLISVTNIAMASVARLISTDVGAIAFAACAAATLIGSGDRPPIARGLWCGLFAALSIWSKQTMAPILLPLIIYAILIGGIGWSTRFAAGLLGAVAVFSVVIVAAFGWRELWFNMVFLPAMRPWQWPWLESASSIWRASKWIWRDIQPVGWMFIGAMFLRVNRFESGETIRGWWRRNFWTLPLLMAITTFPLCAYAYAQEGGSANLAAPASYFGLLAALAALVQGLRHTKETITPRGRLTYLFLMACLAGLMIQAWDKLVKLPQNFAVWTRLSDNDQETAFRFMKKHPQEVYFPSHSLASMLAEGRVYHSFVGMQCLELAKVSVTEPQLSSGLPERIRIIVLRGENITEPLTYLPQYNQPAPLVDMPGWTGLIRSEH